MRDVWDIVTNSHENKGRHPSPKPLAVLTRILDVAGKPGGHVARSVQRQRNRRRCRIELGYALNFY